MKKVFLIAITAIMFLSISNSANAQLESSDFVNYAWKAFSDKTTGAYLSKSITQKAIKQQIEIAYLSAFTFENPTQSDAEDYGKGFAIGLDDAINNSRKNPSKANSFTMGYRDGYSFGLK